MKILIYSEYFFPIPGGVQTIVFELARGLSEWGNNCSVDGRFEVTVVTRTPTSKTKGETWPFRLIRRPSVWQLLRLIRASDIVHLAGPALLPMLICFLFRKPFVVEHHGFHAACPNGLLFFEPNQEPCSGHFMAKRYAKCVVCNRSIVGARKSFYWLVATPVRRWLSNRAYRNVMPTNWLGNMLNLERAVTIYHGISEPPAQQSNNASSSVFAFQGRMVTTKGTGLLLEAMRLLHKQATDPKLKIIGDGPELANFKAETADLNGQVEFLGHVNDSDLESVLSTAGTIVMPSLGGEVFGLVAAENMMRGKLLIVSDIGALKEVVGDTGLIFPVGNVEALATSMRKAFENPSLVRALGTEARERALGIFNRRDMIQAHVSCYKGARRRFTRSL